MSLSRLDSPHERQIYREWLKNASESSLWQSLEWEGYQKALGRETRLYGLKVPLDMRQHVTCATRRDTGALIATALVIIDRTRGGLAVWDIPRGPLGDAKAVGQLLQEIVEEAKSEGVLALYFSPQEKIVDRSSLFVFHSERKTKNYQLKTSARREQPEASVILDLTLSDEELLTQMHEKCRYNIRLAEKRGVVVKESHDVSSFYSLLKETSSRDGFTVKPHCHYERFLTDLPGSFLLLAYEAVSCERDCEQEVSRRINSPAKPPIAGLLGVTWGETGYYYYGASSYAHRALMAPYVLQWEAIKLCRKRGCRKYDLLGISHPSQMPMAKSHTLHPWSGVTRFKMQFGGRIETYPPERVCILRPVLFHLLSLKRKILN